MPCEIFHLLCFLFLRIFLFEWFYLIKHIPFCLLLLLNSGIKLRSCNSELIFRVFVALFFFLVFLSSSSDFFLLKWDHGYATILIKGVFCILLSRHIVLVLVFLLFVIYSGNNLCGWCRDCTLVRKSLFFFLIFLLRILCRDWCIILLMISV